MGGNAAYYVAGYCYYFSRGVTPGSFLYGEVSYRIGLGDSAVRRVIERVANARLVQMIAVRRKLRCADDTIADVLNETVGVVAVPLASQIRMTARDEADMAT